MIDLRVFAIEITGPDEYSASLTIGWDEYNIGRAGHNELVLDHPSVGMRHLCVFHRPPDKLAVWAFHTDNGTWVDGEVVNSARRLLHHGSRIRIGEFELVFTFVAAEELPAAPVATEADLIAACERREPESRNVYADWLEGSGQTARAEYLRVEQELIAIPIGALGVDATLRRDNLESRLRELATVIDVAWRVRLACPRIMACTNLGCGRHWGELDPTELPTVRACSRCDQRVTYCANADDCRAVWRVRGRMVQDVLCPASYGLY